MKIIGHLLVFSVLIYLAGCKQAKKSEEASDSTVVSETMAPQAEIMNGLTDAEKADGWQLLFDGTTSTGWRGYLKDNFPAGWEVADGALHCKGSGRGEAGGVDGGDIMYDKQFQNFDLKLEWKISEGGNSGIFILGQEDKKFPFIYYTSPEMQVLDNERHPDAKLGKDGNRMAGSLYDLIPAVPQNAKPAGEWNSVEITCYQGSVAYFQNGVKVLEYHLWTPGWNEMVAGSKFPALNPDWANVAAKGYIAFQDHGNDVWFRSVKIKEL
jgi:hypothetical protein